jgi:hypothetical protein
VAAGEAVRIIVQMHSVRSRLTASVLAGLVVVGFLGCGSDTGTNWAVLDAGDQLDAEPGEQPEAQLVTDVSDDASGDAALSAAWDGSAVGWDSGPSESLDAGPATDGGDGVGSQVSTVIILPDTQYYAEWFPDIYNAQTDWIVAQAQARNIQAVLHVGDIVDTYDSVDQWNNATPAMRKLDGVVPYVLVPGNHDVYGDLNVRGTIINNYFAPQTMPWIAGTFETGKIENNYALIDIGPRKYLVIGLEWGPRSTALTWADGILKAYAAYPAIIVTHAFLDGDARYNWADPTIKNNQHWDPHYYAETYAADNNVPVADVNDGEEIYQKLIVPNPNVRLVFSGHVLGDPTLGAVGRVTDVRPDGTHIHQMMADYQVIPKDGLFCGLGYLRILEFDSGKKEIRVSTYSPYLSQTMSLPEDEAAFTLPLDDY